MVETVRQLQRVGALEETASADDVAAAVALIREPTRTTAASFCEAIENIAGYGGMKAIHEGGGTSALLTLLEAFLEFEEVVSPAVKAITFLLSGSAERRSFLEAHGVARLLIATRTSGIAGVDAWGVDWSCVALQKLGYSV